MIRQMGVNFPNSFSIIHDARASSSVRDYDDDGVHRDASDRPGVDNEWARVPVSVRADDVSACFKCVKALIPHHPSC